MKQFRIVSVPVLILALALVFAAGPVLAYRGGNSGSDGSISRSMDDTGDTASDSGGDDAAGAQDKGQAVSSVHRKTEGERRHACQAHKHGLETKFSRIIRNGQRIDDRITGVLDKAVAYQQENNVAVDGFDSLVNTAQSAKNNADNAIANLKNITPSLDCNDVSVAGDVASFKDAAAQARDSVKAYRDAVKDVIKALLDAKQADDTAGAGNDGGDQ